MVVLLLVGCATQMPTVPPIGTAGVSHPGKIVWHDLVTPDPKSAKEFYSGLLGWTFEDLTSGYSLARQNGQLVAGVAKLNVSGEPAHWLPLMSVSDIDSALGHTTGSGGEVVLEAFDLPGRGRVAVVRDPEGAAFGVVQSSVGDPEDRRRVVNQWLWNEVWIDDAAAAVEFYGAMEGFEVGESDAFDVRYKYLTRNGIPRFGFLEKSSKNIESTWVSYILVEDVDDAVSRVESLGGTILLAPNPEVRDGLVAIVTDPSGAGLVLQEDKR